MRFYATITHGTRKTAYDYDSKEIYAEYIEASSIQAAKAKLTPSVKSPCFSLWDVDGSSVFFIKKLDNLTNIWYTIISIVDSTLTRNDRCGAIPQL